MNVGQGMGSTIAGGRPSKAHQHQEEGLPGSPGLRQLLQSLAEQPTLSSDMVVEPEATLAAEGLSLTAAELAVLRHLGVNDLGQTRATARSVIRGCAPDSEATSDALAERRREGAQPDIVAPFRDDG